MKFTAPEHTTVAFLSIGPVPVENGFLTVPNDVPAGDLAGLAASGFTIAPADVAAPAAAVKQPPKADQPTEEAKG